MATLNDLAVSVINFGETLERVKREIEAMNDKQPKVYLTIEEAKRIAKKLNDIGLQHEVDFGDFDYDALDLAESLSERIEQVERGHE